MVEYQLKDCVVAQILFRTVCSPWLYMVKYFYVQCIVSNNNIDWLFTIYWEKLVCLLNDLFKWKAKVPDVLLVPFRLASYHVT